MSAPDQKSMRSCIKELKKKNVECLVKACETDYPTDQLEKEGIKVEELIFEDGQLPSSELMQRWL